MKTTDQIKLYSMLDHDYEQNTEGATLLHKTDDPHADLDYLDYPDYPDLRARSGWLLLAVWVLSSVASAVAGWLLVYGLCRAFTAVIG